MVDKSKKLDDSYFMREAINDAKINDHRFGAIIVKDSEIIAKSGKRSKSDARFHAETNAILNASKNLTGCTLYSTCEPCPMCFYMAWVTGVSRLVYGATINDSIDAGLPEIKITAEELNKCGDNKIKIEGNFLRNECLELLKETYKKTINLKV